MNEIHVMGYDGGVVWDGSRPSVCYPVGGQARVSLIFSDETEG